MSGKSSNHGVFSVIDHDHERSFHHHMDRRYYPGRGDPHGEETLPPTLGALRALTSALASWVTAEGIVGNLDDLQQNRKY